MRPAAWRGIRLAYSALRGFTDGVPRRFARNSSDEAFLDFVRRDPLQCRRVPFRWIGALRRWLRSLPRRDLGVGPALILQGDEDRTVDWHYNLPFMQALFPGSRVEYVAGAGHQLANESAALRRQYLEIVVRYLADRGIELGAPPQL